MIEIFNIKSRSFLILKHEFSTCWLVWLNFQFVITKNLLKLCTNFFSLHFYRNIRIILPQTQLPGDENVWNFSYCCKFLNNTCGISRDDINFIAYGFWYLNDDIYGDKFCNCVTNYERDNILLDVQKFDGINW